MPFIHDDILDAALDVLNNFADRTDICSQEPANYTEATSTYSLGNKVEGAPGDTFGNPGNRTPSGRKVDSLAITDGDVTGTGTVSHYAVSDVANVKLLAASSLASSQAVTSGNTFTLGSYEIGIPDPS